MPEGRAKSEMCHFFRLADIVVVVKDPVVGWKTKSRQAFTWNSSCTPILFQPHIVDIAEPRCQYERTLHINRQPLVFHQAAGDIPELPGVESRSKYRGDGEHSNKHSSNDNCIRRANAKAHLLGLIILAAKILLQIFTSANSKCDFGSYISPAFLPSWQSINRPVYSFDTALESKVYFSSSCRGRLHAWSSEDSHHLSQFVIDSTSMSCRLNHHITWAASTLEPRVQSIRRYVPMI